ncbi:MAG: class I SAM-dependent methyltransferase [Pyrinomonadaceae bacterium]
MSWQQEYIARYYSASSGWTDGTFDFHELCRSVIPMGGDILEIGSGPPNPTTKFLASIGRVRGVDIDPDIGLNTALASSHVLAGEDYPFADETFDACVSNYVVEHVDDPAGHLREIKRVLKPGGVYVFRAPNFYHYVSVISHLTPHWFHELVANRLRNLPPESHEPYPTQYRMNTRSAIRRHAADIGFQIDGLRLIEKEPMYGLSSRLLFFPFMAYERFVNRFEALDGIRANILAVLRKGSGP